MSAPSRSAFYRHIDSNVADWVVLRRDLAGNVHLHSNTLNTSITVPESHLVVVNVGESSPLPLTTGSPGSVTASGSPATGVAASVAKSVSAAVLLPARADTHARHTDPATSHDAAEVAKSSAAQNRMRVLLAHAAAGERGLTGDELAAATGLPYSCIGPRRPALEADGLIYATNIRRPSNRGTMQQVYAITDAGRTTAERCVA